MANKTIVNGMSLDEWIRQQKEKNGALIIRQATQRNEWGTTVLKGSISTLSENQDVEYFNADMDIRIGGKLYTMRGRRVERRDGIWYVDGKRQEFPASKGKATTKAHEQLQQDIGDAMSAAFGSGTVNSNGRVGQSHTYSGERVVRTTVRNEFSGGTVIKQGRNISMLNGGTVKINRGGKQYTITGKQLERRAGVWYRDGKPVSDSDTGGAYDDLDVVTLEIHGDVEQLSTVSGDVSVSGDVGNIATASGDIRCQTVRGSVSTASGDVHCSSIGGSVSTMSGDIYER